MSTRIIKDETNSYVVGEMSCVDVYFKKELINNRNFNLSFDSKIKRGMDKWEGHSAYLEIEGLSFEEVDWLNEKQPNTQKLFSQSKAQLVICYGNQDWKSDKSAPHEVSISDNRAFIYWQVESMEYLNGIASALNTKSEISLKIEIACNDKKIGERLDEKLVKEEIYKIAVMFDK